MKAKWLPIETAPKDGTPILGLAEKEMTVVYWNKLEYSKGLGYWALTVCGDFASSSEWNPTHWLPLPTVHEERILDEDSTHRKNL